MAGHTLSYMATLNSSGFMTGLNQMLSGLSGFSGSLNGLKSALGGLGKLLTNPFVLGAAAVTGIALALGSATAAAMQWEDQMANVAKTTGMTGQVLADMSKNILDISINSRTSQQDLAAIAATGGTLGISDIDELTGFTEAINMMTVAFDMTGEEAATQMAHVANSFNAPIEQVQQMGNSINILGNNFATTERDIISALEAIGPTAKQYNETIADSAAYATVLLQQGVDPSEVGTGLQSALKVAAGDPKKMSAWADLMGISVDELNQKLSTDLYGTLQQSGDALLSIENEVDRNALAMELWGAYGGKQIGKLIGQEENLARAREMANEQYGITAGDQGALVDEYNAKNNTSLGIISQIKNTIGAMVIEMGGVVNSSSLMQGALTGIHSALITIRDVGHKAFDFLKTSDIAKSFGSMTSGIQKYLSSITGNLSKLFDPIKQSIEKTFGEGAIGKGIGALFNHLTDSAEIAFEAIGKGFELLASGAEALGPIFETVGKTIGSAIEVIGPKIQQAKTFIEAFANVLKEKIANSETVQKIKTVFDNVANAVKNGLESAKEHLKNFTDDIKKWVADIIDHVKSFIESLGIIDKIKEKLGFETEGSFFSNVMEEFDRLSESLLKTGTETGEEIVNAVEDNKNGIVDVGTEAGKAMANGFEWALSDASGFMRGMEPIYENGNLIGWQSVKEKENVNTPWKEYTSPGISVKDDTEDYAGYYYKKWTRKGSKWATSGTISLESPHIHGIQTFEDYVQRLQDYGYTLEEIGILTKSVNKEEWTPIDVPEGAWGLKNIRETEDGFEVLSKSDFAGAFGKDVSEFLESNKEFAEGYYSDESVSDMLARKTRAEELLWEEAEFTRWTSSMPMDIQNASEEIQKALYNLYSGEEIAGSTAREGGIFQNFLGLDQDSLDDSTKDIIKNVESAWNKIIQYADDSIISQKDWNMLQSYFDLLESKGIDVTAIKTLLSEKVDEIIGGMDKHIKSQMESLGSDVIQYYEDGLLKSEAQDIYDRALGLDKLRVENPQLWEEIGNADMDAFINELIAAEGDVAKIAEITGRYYGEHFNDGVSQTLDIFGNVEPEQLMFNFAENWEETVKKMKDDVTDWNLFRENVALPALKQSLEHEKQLLSTGSESNYKVVKDYIDDLVKLYGEMPEAFGKAEIELINSLQSAAGKGASSQSLIDLMDKYLGTEKATKDLADSTKNLYNEYKNLDECISSTFSEWRNQQPDMFYESIIGSTENYIARVKELAELGRASDTQIEYAASLNGQSVDEFLGKTAELENAANIEAMLESDQALTDAGNLESDISAMVPEMEVSLLTTNALLDAQSLFASIERMNPHMQVSVDVSANAGQIADIAQAAVRDAIASAYSG